MKQNNPENSIDLLLDFLNKRDGLYAEKYNGQIKQNPERLTHVLVQKFYSIEDEERKRTFIRNFHAMLV